MTNLLTLFANNLLPILLVAGIGYIAGKWLNIEAQSISRVVFYIFSPCLLFDLLVSSQLNNGDMLRMIGFTVASVLTVGAITWLLGRLIRLERKTSGSITIARATATRCCWPPESSVGL